MTEPDTTQGPFKPPANDPWKGLRGVMAGTLVLEAIVVLLALPVVGAVGGGVTLFSGLYLVVLAVIMILGAGRQGKPGALYGDIGLQVFVLLGFLIHPSIGAVGVIFGAVWGYIYYLQRDLKKKIARGELYGQRD